MAYKKLYDKSGEKWNLAGHDFSINIRKALAEVICSAGKKYNLRDMEDILLDTVSEMLARIRDARFWETVGGPGKKALEKCLGEK
jgi:hypothetical protein